MMIIQMMVLYTKQSNRDICL